MWRAFWANAGASNAKGIPFRHKLSLIQRATLSIGDQHFARWAFTLDRAKRLDRMQRKMLLVCAGLGAYTAESPEEFWSRRRRTAGKLQSELGKWSVRWATQVTNWKAHIERDPNFSWPSQLHRVRTADELQQRRWMWLRPCTRRVPGFTAARWSESVGLAEDYLTSQR